MVNDIYIYIYLTSLFQSEMLDTRTFERGYRFRIILSLEEESNVNLDIWHREGSWTILC